MIQDGNQSLQKLNVKGFSLCLSVILLASIENVAFIFNFFIKLDN